MWPWLLHGMPSTLLHCTGYYALPLCHWLRFPAAAPPCDTLWPPLQGLLGALLATCFQAGFHLLGSEVDVLALGPACQGLGALQFKMGRGTAESVIAAAADSTLQFLREHSDGGALRRQA